ncbi:MAG: ISKra4 family transposase, partial [Acidimicrobiales bacterium]
MEGNEAAGLTHQELEARLDADGREFIRQLFQDHVDLRSEREQPTAPVLDSGGVEHRFVEPDHHRLLDTIFGTVTVTRLAYRAKAKGAENLHLQDAALNLPQELHSHGLRQLAAIEATRGSYEEAQAGIERATGQALGKRQVEELARRAASHVEGFYDKAKREPAEETDVLVISADGKGIVMRTEDLRPATKKAAKASTHKLRTRLTRGEKKDRKRMAELAVVYDCKPVPREPSDILARKEDGPKPEAPQAKAKWLTASVVTDAKEVIKAAFDEAERRDPEHLRPWVALVDGAKHQIDVIKAEAKKREVDVTIVIDCVHVLEYLW